MKTIKLISPYDWDLWFSLGVCTIRQGEHYNCGQGSMIQQIRNAACVRGVKIRLREGHDYFVISVRGFNDAEVS